MVGGETEGWVERQRGGVRDRGGGWETEGEGERRERARETWGRCGGGGGGYRDSRATRGGGGDIERRGYREKQRLEVQTTWT